MLIGHVDSGIQRDVPLLQSRIAHFRSIDRDGQSTTPLLPRDYGTHGTCTAKVIFGDHYPGLPSLPDEVKLCSIALESPRKAILHFAVAIDALLEFDIRIAFMPVGIQQLTPVFVPLVEALVQRGILVIAPIGNFGAGRACAPGYYPHVLSVGAMGKQGEALRISGSHQDSQGRCQKPEIVAPGWGISGTNGNQGTSIASAFATGVAARLWHAHPGASAWDIWQAMVSTASSSGRLQEKCRWGALQPDKVLAYLDAQPLSAPCGRADEPGPYFDPLLRKQYEGKPLDGLLEAIIVPKAWREGPRGHVMRLLDDVAQVFGETPVRIRPFVHADMAHVEASRRFHESLWGHPDLLISSAVDVDTF